MQTTTAQNAGTLRAALDHEPQVLKFGTSGRRGEVVHLTQLEIYINATGELESLQSLSAGESGIRRGDEFYFAYDLRPSSTRYVPEQGGRGEVAQAIAQAIADAGLRPVNLGPLPTPALTSFALERQRGSMMITGSHIPFDRNGYKTNSAKGELLKKDEPLVNASVERVRRRVYAETFESSAFDRNGAFKGGSRDLPLADRGAAEAYLRRYTDFFSDQQLSGKRLLVYQHSAVGRDILVELLRRLGAEVIAAGRSEQFVPIDTENIDAGQLGTIQRLAELAWAEHGPIDVVVSTDGDSDRPLVLGVEKTDASGGPPCRVRFFGGDLLGMVAAEFLGADAVVVPISCNDAIDRSSLSKMLEPKTRIGSPYVIAGMEEARSKGRGRICGWEANGGFLTGSDIERNGKVLRALPTRDALLPILCALFRASESGGSLSDVFDALPKRFSRAGLLKSFPRAISMWIVERYSAGNPDAARALAEIFTPFGFGAISKLDFTDGIRIYFANNDVAHVRPSGNADELRIYAVADTQKRSDDIVQMGVSEPDGILRKLARSV
jgi:phosphomannomutase